MKNGSLSFYDQTYHEELLAFYLPLEQEQFTALPVDALRKCNEDPGRYPIVITDISGKAVGFFVLHEGENIRDYTSNTNAMVIRALSINQVEQGKGYAKEAMLQLPEFVSKNFPEINELILSVNFKNETAKKVYEKAGFEDRGQIKHGPAGPQYVMHYDIKKQ
ncbi:GNAT family N-acetyltransferase [Fictibacillus barbaricus]|uniref:RimJ/RimL family protein N-acetyltransferase n=1 Tax=Fictibacillus barbaricus TaxID=182136 RepID=A0ABU1U1W4_9BACL|nr:GNAT family protein [Fictibacillus barbaricus]MDR7073480.1 RimJ/RimL family protein N-acetyltransferase [Fictibacillus barbaricus]